MTKIYDIANDYVERYAELNPNSATSIGIPGYDHLMSDFSPAGADANNALNIQTIAALQAATEENDRDRIAKEAIIDDLRVSIDQHEAGEHFRSLRVLGSPLQGIRMIFDLMPRHTEEHWSNIASRLNLLPQTLTGYRSSLQEGLNRGLTSSKRQAAECARQAQVWSGNVEGQDSFFAGLLNAFDESDVKSATLRSEIEKGIEAANRAYTESGDFLTNTYAPAATEEDAVGAERYSLAARAFNGTELDHQTPESGIRLAYE